MSIVGPLVGVSVRWIGRTALVKFYNRTGSWATFRIEGPLDETQIVQIEGNETFSAVYSTDRLIISRPSPTDAPVVLYEGPNQEDLHQ